MPYGTTSEQSIDLTHSVIRNEEVTRPITHKPTVGKWRSLGMGKPRLVFRGPPVLVKLLTLIACRVKLETEGKNRLCCYLTKNNLAGAEVPWWLPRSVVMVPGLSPGSMFPSSKCYVALTVILTVPMSSRLVLLSPFPLEVEGTEVEREGSEFMAWVRFEPGVGCLTPIWVAQVLECHEPQLGGREPLHKVPSSVSGISGQCAQKGYAGVPFRAAEIFLPGSPPPPCNFHTCM